MAHLNLERLQTVRSSEFVFVLFHGFNLFKCQMDFRHREIEREKKYVSVLMEIKQK